MIDVILLALLLALIQLWLLPMMLNISNMPYLLSSRDEPVDESVLLGRAKRAGTNLQESLPAFLALAVLGYVNQVDMVLVASIWLALESGVCPALCLQRDAYSLFSVDGVPRLPHLHGGDVGWRCLTRCPRSQTAAR